MHAVIIIAVTVLPILTNALLETATTSINLTDTGTYIDQLTELEKMLLTNYNRNVRPVKDESKKTIVKFYARIQHIEEVDEIEQAITVHGNFFWMWDDENMVWEVEKYNTPSFTLHGWYVWKPDIVLYNAGGGVETSRQAAQYQYVMVSNQGKMRYSPFFTFRATCIFDFSDYPNDIQECPLILGSWNYPLSQLEIEDTAAAWSSMAWNDSKTVVSGWELLNTKINFTYWNAHRQARVDVKPPVTEQMTTFTEINIWLKLKRHAPYFGVVVLLPSVMTSFFTLAAFWTISTAHGIAVLLVNVIIQAVFTEDLLQNIPPTTGSVPRIVRYFAFNLTATVLAVILLMIFKTIESVRDEHRSLPPALAALVRARERAQAAVMNKIGYKARAGDSDTERIHDAQADDDEDEANRQQIKTESHEGTSAKITAGDATWFGLADLVKKACFALYALIYVSLMFAWLC